MSRRWQEILGVAAIVVGCFVLCLLSIRDKSPTFDETTHLTGGVARWFFQDSRIQPENGNLPQLWSTLPLWLWSAELRLPDTTAEQWRLASQYDVARQFLYEQGNDHEVIVWRGRAMMAILTALLLILVYRWAKSLWGIKGGFLALMVAATSPTLLAHGRLVTSDLPVTLFLLLTAACFWRMLQRVTIVSVLMTGCSAGLLLLAKHSGLVFAPLAVALCCIRVVRGRTLEWNLWGRTRRVVGRGGQTLVLVVAQVVAAAIALTVLWGGYGFQYSVVQEPDSEHLELGRPWEELVSDEDWWAAPMGWAREHQLLPEAFLYGNAYVLRHSAARLSFAAGAIDTEGRWWFFPYAWLLKTRIPFIGLCLGAVIWWWRRRRSGESGDNATARDDSWIPLLAICIVFWAIAVTSQLNLGLRHVLPAEPALWIFAGSLGTLPRRRTWSQAFVTLAMVWCMVTTARAFPDYLAYFHEAVPVTARHEFLVDSSLDWGQDLPALAQWLGEQEPAIDPNDVYCSYFGTADPPAYGVHARRLKSMLPWRYPADSPVDVNPFFPCRPGWYCVSATMLQGVYLQPPGWTDWHEDTYQSLRKQFDAFFAREQSPAQLARLSRDPKFARNYLTFDVLRMGRLGRFLRNLEPAAVVGGGSILIYSLNAEQLDRALD